MQDPKTSALDSTTAAPAGVGLWAGRAITARSIFVGLISVAALTVATVYSDFKLYGTSISTNGLPIGAFTLFLILVAVINTVLRRISVRLALEAKELLVVYIMMLAAAPFCSVALTVPSIITSVGSTYLTIKDKHWVDAFFQYVPDWFRVTDVRAAAWFYEGKPPSAAIPWGAWLTPLTMWLIFGLLWYFAYFCLAALVRRQWIEHERLAFPLAELPLQIVRGDDQPTIASPFFRNGLVWAGFIFPWALHTLNGLHRYYPELPSFQLADFHPLLGVFTNLPWSMIRWLPVSFYFSIIGLTYLISSQVSGSSVLFYALTRMEMVVFATFGIYSMSNSDPTKFSIMQFFNNQQIGAMLAITIITFWSIRKTLTRRPHTPDGLSGPWGLSTEQWALAGVLLSFGLIGVWGIFAGANFFWQIIYVAIYSFSAFALVRVAAAGGFILLDVNFLPIDPMLQCFSTSAFTARDLTVFSYEGMACWWNPGWANPLQVFSHGLRIGTSARIDLRKISVAIGAAVLLTTIFGTLLTLWFVYQGYAPHNYGYSSPRHYLTPWHLNKLVNMLSNPVPVQAHVYIGIGIGVGMMLLLSYLNRNLTWFTISPLGYLVGQIWMIDMMWMSLLIGWLLNLLVCRYLGLNWYRRLRPFFLGLILGEFFAAAQWLVVNAITHTHGYAIFPSAG
jgi:hypothetical protein